MIKRFLDYQIRKEIKRDNKKQNHKSYTNSLNAFSRIWHLIKYHKKKSILGVLMLILDWRYDLKTSVYYYVINMEPIHHKAFRILLGYSRHTASSIKISRYQPTKQQQLSIQGIKLNPLTIQSLIKIFYQTDKELYFGVGRNYLHKVYKQLGLLDNPQDQKIYWQMTGFHKERNQKASGVGCIEFVKMFRQAFEKLKKKMPQLTQELFFKKFIQIFISKFNETKIWEKQFNIQRQRQFIKNAPGDGQKRQNLITSIMKQNSSIEQKQLQIKMQELGMKGMNLTDRHLYWRNRAVWFGLQKYYIQKKMRVAYQNQKKELQRDFIKATEYFEDAQRNREKAFEDFQRMYKKQMFQ